MNKFVVKNESPPPSLVVYRQQVLAQATHQGDLWITRYPLSHDLFKENWGLTTLNVEHYGGRRSLEDYRLVLPMQEQYNALWKTRIKALKPKE